MKRICAVVALAALFQYHSAHAECRAVNLGDAPEWAAMNAEESYDAEIEYDATRLIQFDPSIIDVDATLGVGDTIATGYSVSSGNAAILRCDGPTGTIQFHLSNGGSTDIQTDGMPNGVGYRVRYGRKGDAGTVVPFTVPWIKPVDKPAQYPFMADGNIFWIELIKMADMDSASTINLGEVAYVVGGGNIADHALTVRANPVTLRVLPHCQVTGDKPLLVDFGPFGPREVSTSSGPTQPVTIKVTCDGPTPPNTISATLAAQSDPDVSDFIKNDGSASGLAIRLRDAATQAVLKPLDLTSVLTRTSPGFGTTFELEASVLRVGAAAAVPGTIDAQATVTLTFL